LDPSIRAIGFVSLKKPWLLEVSFRRSRRPSKAAILAAPNRLCFHINQPARVVHVHNPSISDGPLSERAHVPVAVRMDFGAGVPFSVDEIALPYQSARIIHVHPSQTLSFHGRLLFSSESPCPRKVVFAMGVGIYSWGGQSPPLRRVRYQIGPANLPRFITEGIAGRRSEPGILVRTGC
jgi:hypothetical protein